MKIHKILIKTNLKKVQPNHLHPEHAEVGLVDWLVHRSVEAQPDNGPGVPRVDHTVVPQPGAGEVRVALVLEPLYDGPLQSLLLLSGELLALTTLLLPGDGCQHGGGLLAPHHRYSGVRPRVHEPNDEKLLNFRK